MDEEYSKDEAREAREELEKDKREAREEILDKLGPSAFRAHLEGNMIDQLTCFVSVSTLTDDEREMVRGHISEYLKTYLLNGVWMLTKKEHNLSIIYPSDTWNDKALLRVRGL